MLNTQVSAGIDSEWVRSQFPSLDLQVNGQPVVYLDNPAGTQVPVRVGEAIAEYLASANANVHGAFLTSQRTDAMLVEARQGMAAFLNAASPREIAFGPNMTTITYALSRAIGREFSAGDEVIITGLDHDANISPWSDLSEHGVVVKQVPVRLEDCTLDMETLGNLLTKRTGLVAVTFASNAVGTVPDLLRIVEMAHAVGALVWVDAVHYGPHGPIDVQALDVDYLVCSSYKFFGPHQGILYGKEALLEKLQPYQLRPAPHTVPEKFETGTKNHECLAGLVATLDYLEKLGRKACRLSPEVEQREALHAAMHTVREYEKGLSLALLEGLESVPGLRIYGITDRSRLDERVPTFCFTIEGQATPEIGLRLGERGIFAWTGNYYALEIMDRLGLEGKGGAVRIGAVHYNTVEEVDRLVRTLHEIVG